MFPQPSGWVLLRLVSHLRHNSFVRRAIGPPELVNPLLSLSALSAPLLSTSPSRTEYVLTQSDIVPFLQDLAHRFDPSGELDGILAPVVSIFLSHESLFRQEGLGGADTTWRGVLSGLEVLASIKPIAIMMTRMENWIPEGVTAERFEKDSLLGPLCRLGVFPYEWVSLFQPLMLLSPIFTLLVATYCKDLFRKSRWKDQRWCRFVIRQSERYTQNSTGWLGISWVRFFLFRLILFL